MFKKTIVPIVSMAVLAVSLIVPSSAFAAQSSVIQTKAISISSKENIQQEKVQPEWKTKVTKKAIRGLIEALDDRRKIEAVKDALRKLPGGDDAARYLDDGISYIQKNLKELLEWGDVFENNVRDAISGALYDAGVPLSIARGIAWVIVEVLL
ncbi:hypothetical protein [Brevibacillus formosus]|uniref:hypothetical protein n=1 Tax=Brevibacillus formosus TaxID=54913 RepID=UPI003F1C8A24